MNDKGYPRNTLHDRRGKVIGISHGMEIFPAYKGLAALTVEEMYEMLKSSGEGYIMQDDDPLLHPWCLKHSDPNFCKEI